MKVPENSIHEKIQCWHCKHLQEKFPKMRCNKLKQKIHPVIFLQDLQNGCDTFDVKDETIYSRFLTHYAAIKAEKQVVMN